MNLKKKRTVKTGHLILFAAVLCTLLLLIIPLYRISYNTMKNKIRSQIQLQAEKMSKLIDMEALMLHSIKAELPSDSMYTMMKNLTNFESSSQYIILKNFSDMFESRAGMMPVSDYAYIFFNNNNVAVGKDIIIDDISKNFKQYIDMDGKDYDEFRSCIFSNNIGMTVRYVENMKLYGEAAPSIIIICPIDQHIQQPTEAAIVTIYKVETLFSEFGDDYKKVFDHIAVNNDVIFDDGIKRNDETIAAVCRNIDLRFTMSVSNGYFSEYMKGFIRFAYSYILALVLLAIIIELVMDWYMKRPIRSMAHLVADIIDDGELKDEKDIIDALNRLNINKQDYEKAFLTTLFLKPLDPDECEFVYKKYPNFPRRYMFAVFYGENINEKIIKLMLDKFGMSSEFVLSARQNECVAFFEYSANVDEKKLRTMLDNMVFEAKKRGVVLTVLISIPCSNLGDFYSMYNRIQSYSRFIDYDGVFEMERRKGAAAADDEDITRISEKLHALIAGGQAFEAKQMVYEQWYSAMTGSDMSDSIIEKLFYSQIGVLSDIAIKIGYKGELVKYNRKMKINELAFSIADDVDSVCELINSRKQSNSEYDNVIKYIDENYTLMNFGMPDVEEHFGITGKTINKIVKSKTGKTFSEYIEKHRIELAKKLIDEGGCDIKSVSEKCGFQNYDTFYKFFKKHTGVAPAKWRAARIIEHGFEKKE